jgi:hypothetical protein
MADIGVEADVGVYDRTPHIPENRRSDRSIIQQNKGIYLSIN